MTRSSPDSATVRDEIIERTNRLLSPDFIPDEADAFADEVLSIVLKHLKTVAWRRISDDGVETFWHSEVPQSSALCLLPSWNTRASQPATPTGGETEPVAWMITGLDGSAAFTETKPMITTPAHRVTPLYATPTGGEAEPASMIDNLLMTGYLDGRTPARSSAGSEGPDIVRTALERAREYVYPDDDVPGLLQDIDSALASLDAAQPSADIEGALPPVKPLEMVDYSAGYKMPAPPMYRVMVDKYCIDFETETAANNVRNAILALAGGAAQPSGVQKAAKKAVKLFRTPNDDSFYQAMLDLEAALAVPSTDREGK